MTPDEIRGQGLTTSLPFAGRCYGICARTAYELHQRGEFPVPVMRLGARLRVRTADLLDDLGYPLEAAS